jgi:transposase-like protein
MNFVKLSKLTEDQARDYLEAVRWGANGERRVCPHCMSTESIKLAGKSTRPGVYKCKNRECRKQFTVTVGTVMERGHIKIRIWLMAIHLLSASKKGMSAHQLHRMLGVTYKTAWFMAHRIRYSMKQEPLAGALKGAVEVDETYVGGKPRYRSGSNPRGTANKAPVMVLVERDGSARVKPVEFVDTKTLHAEVIANVDKSATVVTDEMASYRNLGPHFAGGHHFVTHRNRQYVRVNESGFKVTTNTAESFFALIKRGHYGTYHKMSKKHLHRYCDEFGFRWNYRKVTDSERSFAAITGIEGKRLMYREPTQ